MHAAALTQLHPQPRLPQPLHPKFHQFPLLCSHDCLPQPPHLHHQRMLLLGNRGRGAGQGNQGNASAGRGAGLFGGKNLWQNGSAHWKRGAQCALRACAWACACNMGMPSAPERQRWLPSSTSSPAAEHHPGALHLSSQLGAPVLGPGCAQPHRNLQDAAVRVSVHAAAVQGHGAGRAGSQTGAAAAALVQLACQHGSATQPCCHHVLPHRSYADPMRGYSQRCAATLLGWEVQYPAKSRLCLQVGAGSSA